MQEITDASTITNIWIYLMLLETVESNGIVEKMSDAYDLYSPLFNQLVINRTKRSH